MQKTGLVLSHTSLPYLVLQLVTREMEKRGNAGSHVPNYKSIASEKERLDFVDS